MVPSIMGGGEVVDIEKVTLIHQKNQGVTAARRTGVEHATGDWICFLDSDDTLYPSFLEHLSAQIDDNTDIIVSSAPCKNILNRKEYIEALLNTDISTVPFCKLFRKTLFDDGCALNMPRDIVRGEDMLMNLRLAYRTSKNIVTIAENEYNYRKHAGQTVATFNSTSTFESMFYNELKATFSQEDYNRFLPGLIRSRIYAYHLILSKQHITKDFGVKETSWFKTLLEDITRTNYRMSVWEWLIMNVANRHNVKYICFVFSLPKRILQKISKNLI